MARGVAASLARGWSVVLLVAGSALAAPPTPQDGAAQRRTNALAALPPPIRAAVEARADRDAVLDGAAPLVTLTGHTDAIRAVAFAPGGLRLASGGNDRTARIWNLLDGARVLLMKEDLTSISDVAFSPDGALLATTGSDDTKHQQHTIRLWSTADGSLVRALRGHGGGTGGINSVAWSPDGTLLISAARDYTARIWRTAPGDLRTTLVGHQQQPTWAGFAPDGRLAASASPDGALRLWDVATGKPVGSVAGAGRAAFSPDGVWLATGVGADCVLYEVAKQREVRRIAGAGAPVAFTPDGRHLIAAGRLWDVNGGTAVRALAGAVSAISRDGMLVAGVDGVLARVWVLPEATPGGTTPGAARTAAAARATFEAACEAADKAADLPALVAATAAFVAAHPDDPVANAWQQCAAGLQAARAGLAQRQGSLATKTLSDLPAMAIAPVLRAAVRGERDALYRQFEDACRAALDRGDADAAALAVRAFVAVFPDDAGAQTWARDLASQVRLEQMLAAFPKPLRVAIEGRADRSRVLTGDVPLQVLRGHKERTGIVGLVFPKGGRLVASAGTDNTVRIWDALGGREVRTCTGHRRDITDLDVSGDGRLLVSSSLDGTARVWDVGSGREVRTFIERDDGVQGYFVYSAVAAPKGRLVVSYVTGGRNHEHKVRIWNLDTGHPVTTIENSRISRGAVFSPDARWLLHPANPARLIDVASGKELRTYGSGACTAAAFAPDGRRVALAVGGAIQLLDVKTGDEAAALPGVDGVTRLAFTPDGRFLLACAANGTVHVVEVAALTTRRTFTGSSLLAMDPEGRLCATIGADAGAPLVNVWVLPEAGR